jgi:hypothetical protein
MATCPAFVEYIATLDDPRGWRGRWHPLAAMVALARLPMTLGGPQSLWAGKPYCPMLPSERAHATVAPKACCLGASEGGPQCRHTRLQLLGTSCLLARPLAAAVSRATPCGAPLDAATCPLPGSPQAATFAFVLVMWVLLPALWHVLWRRPRAQ